MPVSTDVPKAKKPKKAKKVYTVARDSGMTMGMMEPPPKPPAPAEIIEFRSNLLARMTGESAKASGDPDKTQTWYHLWLSVTHQYDFDTPVEVDEDQGGAED